MSIAEVKTSADQKMLKAIESLKTSLSRIRTGRAHIGILDHIHVDYYGSSVPIGQVANITLIDARTLGVSPWERKMAAAVDKAIRDSGLGLNPQTEGQVIRVPLPDLTQERRKELSKVAHKYAEQARISVRNIRRHAKQTLEKLEKDGEVGKDDAAAAEKRLEGLTKDHTDSIDDMLKHQEAELLEV